MNILHITASPLSKNGGIPVVLNMLAHEQAKIHGIKVCVLSLSAPVTHYDAQLFLYIKLENLDNFIADFQPDIVIFHGHFYPKYVRAAHVLRQLHIPYFIEPHGSFGYAAMQKSKFKKRIAYYLLFRPYIKQASGFIFLNQAERQDSIYHTKHELVIPNGIADLPAKHASQQPWSFYFIGRYDINHKGLDVLLDALEILDKRRKEIDVHFFGKGTSTAETYLNRRAEQLKYVRLIIHPAIHGTKKDYLLNGRGIMLLTSRYEGFPMTVLESWAYGNPCLVTPGTNVAAEIAENKLGWVSTFDKTTIADTILQAVREYNTEYIFQCRHYVQTHYLWKQIAGHSIAAFAHVLKEIKS